MSKKPVLFVSFRPLERAENIRAIYEAYPGEKAHILQSDPNYASEVLSGKYDLMVTDDFPTITPGQCIMIWHGIQGGKKIGLDQRPSFYRREYAKYISCIVAASHDAIPLWQSATGVNESRIIPFGMPRTDAYIGKRKGNGHTILSEYRRAYLFAPTFREIGEPAFPEIDWEYIDSRLKDDEVFAIKAHPWQYYQFRNADQVTRHLDISKCKHIRIIPECEQSAPYLYDADVVITDYSSIMFDAYILGKPVVLFEKSKGYVDARGMYLDYPDEYCSRYSADETCLLFHMRDAFQTGMRETERSCLHKVAATCDGHSCERICDLINYYTPIL